MQYIFLTEETEEVVEHVSKTVSAIQDHMPEIQSFLIRLVISLVIYLVGRVLIKGLLKVFDKTTLKASGDVTLQRFLQQAATSPCSAFCIRLQTSCFTLRLSSSS